MKQLINTTTYLLLMEKSEQKELNQYSSNAKDLGTIISHLPLNGKKALDGIPIMSLEDFIVFDYVILGYKMILLISQGESMSSIQYTIHESNLIDFLKGTEFEDLDYFWEYQTREDILSKFTDFVNAIKSQYNVSK